MIGRGICLLLGVPVVWAQESVPTIVGGIRTEVIQKEAKARMPLKAETLLRRVVDRDGRKITVEVIEEPTAAALQTERPNISPTPDEENSGPPPSTFSYSVMATKAGDLTRVKWQAMGGGNDKTYVTWSNIDWSLFDGFQTIEDGGVRSSFMLLFNEMSPEDFQKRANRLGLEPAPNHLSSFEEVGARYFTENDQALAAAPKSFMEALHTLVEHRFEDLQQAKASRIASARKIAEERRNNPPKPQDVVIQFWKKTKKENSNQKD